MFSEGKLSAKSEEALRIAYKSAASLGHFHVGSEHLLYGILAQGEGFASTLLFKSGVSREKLYLKIKDAIGCGDSLKTCPQGLAPCAERVIASAFAEADKSNCSYISTEHMLLGILSLTDCCANRILTSLGVDTKRLYNDARAASSRDLNTQKERHNSEKLIRQFGNDLTEKARLGNLDPIVGRDCEINRMMCILARRSKNNPLLIGEPGVGKTAVVEGLARQISLGVVPDLLKKYRIIALDIPSIIAGTKYRGEFEDRVKNLLREVKAAGNIILFIDEMHMISGAGAAEGAIDAANILKPALSRGEIKLIGATTTAEYRRHIEKDPALARRFQSIKIDEPSAAKTLEILKGLRHAYQSHHRLEISDEILSSAISLSTRYLSDRFLPDKAIDLIDEAAGRASFDAKPLTEAYLRQVIFDRTGIPVIKGKDEIPLHKRLEGRVFGQEKAIISLSNAILRASVGLSDPNRPNGSFLFLGQSGVGKTELAKALADELFGQKSALIRIDMSEYMERHTVSKLIGAPAGYVGYNDGGYLTEKVRRNPYSLILLDEIEKAHPDILNIFLQILEDGILQDSNGNICDFKNTVIIMTSNIGARFLEPSSQIGFSEGKDIPTSRALSQLKKQLPPELLGRIDDIIVFAPLDVPSLEKIAACMLNKCILRAKENGINIQVDHGVISSLARRAYEKKQGARPLRRMIEEEILTKIAESTLDPHSTKSIKCILCNDIPSIMHI